MTGSRQRLYHALASLKIYALGQNSLIDAELEAYIAAFSILEELLFQIKTQSFVQTASGEGLKRHEKLVGMQERLFTDEEIRRELVLYRLSVAPFDFTPSKMLGSVRAAGMEAELVQQPGTESLVIVAKRIIDESLSMDSIKASLATMLPAHLEWEFDFGEMTWDMFESAGVGWDVWDKKDFTWDAFDSEGDKIFN